MEALVEPEIKDANTEQSADRKPERRERGSGRIWQVGKRWWIQYYVNGRQVRETSRSTTKAVAERLLKKRLAQAEAGLVPSDRVNRLRYEEMREALYADYRANKRKSLGLRKEDDTEQICGLKHLDDFFAGYRATNITTDRIREFIAKRQSAGAGNGTINRSLSALRRMFRLAVQDGKLQVQNIPHFPMLQEPPARSGFLEHNEYVSLRDGLPEQLRPILAMGYYTGMRLGEIRKLRWGQVDFLNAEINLPPGTTKNNEPRIIPLNDLPELGDMLRLLFKARNPDCEFIFSRDGRKPMNFPYKAWQTACIKTGLGRMVCTGCSTTVVGKRRCRDCKKAGRPARLKYQGLTPHDQRRTALTNLTEAGVPEVDAMLISGHKTRAVFDRYHIARKKVLKNAARRLSAYLTEQNGANSGRIEPTPTSHPPLTN